MADKTKPVELDRVMDFSKSGNLNIIDVTKLLKDEGTVGIGEIKLAPVDCVKCGEEQIHGYITYGEKHHMCYECGGIFNNWMYDKLVREWLNE